MQFLKNGDVSAKNTHISAAATRHRKLNLVSNLSKDIPLNLLVRYANYLILIFMNFNENIRMNKNAENARWYIYK